MNPRWLSEVKARIGKCLMFGTNAEQTRFAGNILKEVGNDWKELVAGKEGYLINSKRAGLVGQKVVWGEMDTMGHVNNVMYARYAESARINWVSNYGLYVDPKNRDRWFTTWTPKGVGMILKTLTTEFKFPMTWPDRISVYHKLAKPVNAQDDSFTLQVMILSEVHRKPAARCLEEIVMYDYRKGKKTTMPDFMVDAFEKTWGEQIAASERANKRLEAVEGRVRELEKATWDRADAVEDMGGLKPDGSATL